MINKPKVIRSKVVYDGWLKVRRDILQVPGLERSYDYDVVIIPGNGVGVLPFIDKDNLLLQYQYRHAIGRKVLELVQGGRSKNEKPIDAARRELLEETGYEGELHYLNGLYLMPGSVSMDYSIFYANNLRKLREPEDNPIEAAEIVIIPYEQVLREIISGKHKDSALVSAILFYEAARIN